MAYVRALFGVFLVTLRVLIIRAPRTVRTHGSAAGSATAAPFCEHSVRVTVQQRGVTSWQCHLGLTVVYYAVLNRPAQNRPSIQVKHTKS